VSSSSLETSCAGGETDGAMENSVENPIDMNQNRSTNTPYHVCLPRGGSSCIEADSPRRAGESAGVSTLGSGSPVASKLIRLGVQEMGLPRSWILYGSSLDKQHWRWEFSCTD
jgi:hypothetical protein